MNIIERCRKWADGFDHYILSGVAAWNKEALENQKRDWLAAADTLLALQKAREKMARICDELAARKGKDDEAENEAEVCAGRIRQTDLSDCRVVLEDCNDPVWNSLHCTCGASGVAIMAHEPHCAVILVESLSAQVAELQTNYQELLYGVARKFPGETRHQTALRYIRNAETVSVNSGCAAAKESGMGRGRTQKRTPQ